MVSPSTSVNTMRKTIQKLVDLPFKSFIRVSITYALLGVSSWGLFLLVFPKVLSRHNVLHHEELELVWRLVDLNDASFLVIRHCAVPWFITLITASALMCHQLFFIHRNKGQTNTARLVNWLHLAVSILLFTGSVAIVLVLFFM